MQLSLATKFCDLQSTSKQSTMSSFSCCLVCGGGASSRQKTTKSGVQVTGGLAEAACRQQAACRQRGLKTLVEQEDCTISLALDCIGTTRLWWMGLQSLMLTGKSRMMINDPLQAKKLDWHGLSNGLQLKGLIKRRSKRWNSQNNERGAVLCSGRRMQTTLSGGPGR